MTAAVRERVATLNALHAKALPAAYGGATVIAYEEVDNARLRLPRWALAMKRLKGWEQYVHNGVAASAVRITWDATVWEFVEGGGQRAHLGMKRVSPHRWIVWVVLRHRETGELVRFVVTHMVSGVRGEGKDPVEWRRRNWTAHLVMLVRLVAGWVGDGEKVVVLGDFNRAPAESDQAGVELKPLHLAARSNENGGIDQIWSNLTARNAREGDDHGSDHRIVLTDLTLVGATPPKPPEDVVTDDRYELTTHDGKTVDRMTKQALEKAERRLGYPLTVVQGSFHRGVSQSAGTHDGGGVVDLAPWDWENKVRVLRTIGFAAWHRTPAQGPWGEHCHCVLIGDEKASPAALRQVESYKRGRNGLANNGLDDFWRPATIKPYKYAPPPPPSRISVFRDAVEQALAVTLPKIDPIDRPAADRMLKAIQAALDSGPKA